MALRKIKSTGRKYLIYEALENIFCISFFYLVECSHRKLRSLFRTFSKENLVKWDTVLQSIEGQGGKLSQLATSYDSKTTL